MANYAKSETKVLIPNTAVPTGVATVLQSKLQDTRYALSASFLLRYGRSAVGVTPAPPTFYIERLSDDGYATLVRYTGGASPGAIGTLLAASAAKGDDTLTVVDTSGLKDGEDVVVRDSTGVATEYNKIKEVVDLTTLRLMDSLLFDKTTSDSVYNGAQTWEFSIDLTSIRNFRVLLYQPAAGTVAADISVSCVFCYGTKE